MRLSGIPLSGRLPSDSQKAYAEYEKRNTEQYVKDIEAYNEAELVNGMRDLELRLLIVPELRSTDLRLHRLYQVQAAVTRDQQLRQSAVGVAFCPAYNLSGFGFDAFWSQCSSFMRAVQKVPQ